MGDEPVGGGEIDAQIPFLGADLAFERLDVERRRHALLEFFPDVHGVFLAK